MYSTFFLRFCFLKILKFIFDDWFYFTRHSYKPWKPLQFLTCILYFWGWLGTFTIQLWHITESLLHRPLVLWLASFFSVRYFVSHWAQWNLKSLLQVCSPLSRVSCLLTINPHFGQATSVFLPILWASHRCLAVFVTFWQWGQGALDRFLASGRVGDGPWAGSSWGRRKEAEVATCSPMQSKPSFIGATTLIHKSTAFNSLSPLVYSSNSSFSIGLSNICSSSSTSLKNSF